MSGRSRCAAAADLGVRLLTVRNGIDGPRDREMDAAPAERLEGTAAALRRLRGANAVQRRDGSRHIISS